MKTILVADISFGRPNGLFGVTVEDFLLPRTNTNRYKASFLPSALSVLMKIIPATNRVCACDKTSVEDNFLREGWGCMNLMMFI